MATAASAEPTRYTIDPTRTFPRFEADPMGISVWRDPLNKSSLQSPVNGVPSARHDILKSPGIA